MDNKIVSTAYVPLQPPYQIIMYDHDVAMQIGTLIVTVQARCSFWSGTPRARRRCRRRFCRSPAARSTGPAARGTR